jgi:hypothetical protein
VALKLRPAGATDKIESLHWTFRQEWRPRADSFKRMLGRAFIHEQGIDELFEAMVDGGEVIVWPEPLNLKLVGDEVPEFSFVVVCQRQTEPTKVVEPLT